jgi:alcohol dehydrogenase
MSAHIQLELRKFVAPEFVFGAGARLLAGRYARNFGAGRVLVVTDRGVTAAGWTEDVLQSLREQNLSYTVFQDITPNPRAAEVMSGSRVYDAEGCDAIVAVGGGSPMDCAKGIGIVCTNGGNILDYEGVDKVERPLPPLICVPTTAGSSADVSQFGIVTDLERKVKIAIVSKTIVPDVALIDPVATTTMDRTLTAHTGMDALCHAVEAFVSNAHSPITDMHASEAIRLIYDSLPRAVEDLLDLQLRGKMMLGSLFAGLAFSNASLGAVHAMAHSLGGLLDLPHGECNAILLEHVVRYNFSSASDRYRIIARITGIEEGDLTDAEAQRALVGRIADLRKAVGVDGSLGSLGMSHSAVKELAQNAVHDCCLVTNPAAPTVTDIEAIYERAL